MFECQCGNKTWTSEKAESLSTRRLKVQMKKQSGKPAEHNCPACNGTGFAAVTQPLQPVRKIYPARCKNCAGKGRITEAAN
jgi:DnaJ-class molecular chaperone